jgi:hypothetical protein
MLTDCCCVVARGHCTCQETERNQRDKYTVAPFSHVRTALGVGWIGLQLKEALYLLRLTNRVCRRLIYTPYPVVEGHWPATGLRTHASRHGMAD